MRSITSGASRMWSRLLLVVLLAATPLAACGDGSAPASPTATASPATSGDPSGATATASLASVRDIDFTAPAVIGPLIDHFSGGQVDPRRVQYVDVDRDGADEAFVVVESGGTAGDLGAALIGVDEGRIETLGYVETGGRVEIRFPEIGGGLVVTTEGVWEPGDAECCPSRLRETTYEWSGGEFVLRDEQVIDNPDID